MKRVIVYIAIVLLTLAGLTGWGQAPGWNVDARNYQYSMNIVAFLHVDGNSLTAEEDRVAAFVNGEVRGVGSPVYVPSADRYLVYLTVYANTEGETLTFRIYSSTTGNTVDAVATLPFTIDGQRGNAFRAFSIARPALNDGADILAYGFAGQDSIQTTIEGDAIQIVVEYDQDLTVLIPEFALSPGARLYHDRTLQESGAHTLDFSAPVVFSVVSEDESRLKEWRVIAVNRLTTTESFQCTNVITANGDGANDYWIVQDVFKYTHHFFRIFDANGRVVYQSTGYDNSWNGYYRGARLARGKYYYVVVDPETLAAMQGDILVLY